jgi:hypothetical protein
MTTEIDGDDASDIGPIGFVTPHEQAEQERWRIKLEEEDFFKIGVESYDEFFELCALRWHGVPKARRTDYRWLHYQRAEFLKQWSAEDNRARLDAPKPKQWTPPPRRKGKRSNFAEWQRIRQR